MPTDKQHRIEPTQAQDELSLLCEVNEILEHSLDLQQVANPILEAIAHHLRMECAAITLINRKTDEIIIEAAYGLTPQQAQRGIYRIGEGITGQVALTGEPMIVERSSESDHFTNRTGRKVKTDISLACVPIRAGNEVAGTLSVDCHYQEGIDLHANVRVLRIVASMIAQAVKLRRALKENLNHLQEENERLRAELQHRFRPSNIVGNSREMQIVYDQIAQVRHNPVTVLLQGETGTGKELVAHAIHYNSERANQPFVRVHCAALSESIIESELFGHVRGAFTGATADRKGRFELAHGGTLFFDEISEIPLAVQTKLLRVLQEREFEKVGGTATVTVNVRLITATNRNLQEMVNKGEFREDLFYRLHVFPIYIPPLRKRKADIALLADFFLERYSKQYNRSVRRVSSAVIDMLYAYHWPGNVRELENIMERAVLVSQEEVVHPHHLPPTLQTAETSGTLPQGNLKHLVASYERDIIVDALKSTRGNIAGAARTLGSTARILGYKIEKYKIDPRQYAG